MEKTAEGQVSSSSKSTLICVAVIVPSLAFTCYLTLWVSPSFVAIPILFLSTIFVLSFSKKKRVITFENQGQDENPTCSSKSLLEKEVEGRLNLDFGTVSQYNGDQQSEEVLQMDEYQVESTDFPFDGESSDDFSRSDDFELSWMCSDNVVENVTISESSLSGNNDEDDDNLIEISLPKNNSVDSNRDSKQKFRSEFPVYTTESISSQEGLMEFLAEINESNEEENLIEIDLSVGSIKCSDLEIEA